MEKITVKIFIRGSYYGESAGAILKRAKVVWTRNGQFEIVSEREEIITSNGLEIFLANSDGPVARITMSMQARKRFRQLETEKSRAAA